MMNIFTAHQIVSLTGISFERKSIIVSIIIVLRIIPSCSNFIVVLGIRRTHCSSFTRQFEGSQIECQAMSNL